MKLGMEVGLDTGHTVLDGDKAPSPKGTPILAHVCCCQTAGWIKMPLDRPRHCVRWGPSSQLTPSPQKGGTSRPHFSAHVLWPNGCMDQDASWYGGRPRLWPHCVRWDLAPPPKGHTPNFRPMSVVAKRLDGSRYHLAGR